MVSVHMHSLNLLRVENTSLFMGFLLRNSSLFFHEETVVVGQCCVVLDMSKRLYTEDITMTIEPGWGI